MPDLYRKERRRKRLQQKKEHTLPSHTGGGSKYRRTHNSRSDDELMTQLAEDMKHANN